LHIPYRSSLLAAGEGGGYDALRAVISQHCAQGLNDGEIEALIVELDRISTMIEMENR